MPRTRQIAARLALLFALAPCLPSLGCNVVRVEGDILERKLKRVGVEEKHVQLGSAQVRYWEGGPPQTRPTLLLHGFGAHALFQWVPQAKELAKDRRVIMPDLLWFGASSSQDKDFSLDHQVRVVLELLDHLKVKQVDLIGVSYGGLMGVELASRAPDRVGRMVLVDSPGRTYRPEDLQDLRKKFGVKEEAELLVPDDVEGVQRLMEIAYYRPPRILPKWVRRQVLEEFYQNNREEQAELLRSLAGQMEELARRPSPKQTPTMIIWGADDPVFPIAVGQRLHRHLGPHIRFEVIDKARHAPNLEHPKEFNALMLSFLPPVPAR